MDTLLSMHFRVHSRWPDCVICFALSKVPAVNLIKCDSVTDRMTDKNTPEDKTHFPFDMLCNTIEMEMTLSLCSILLRNYPLLAIAIIHTMDVARKISTNIQYQYSVLHLFLK